MSRVRLKTTGEARLNEGKRDIFHRSTRHSPTRSPAHSAGWGCGLAENGQSGQDGLNIAGDPANVGIALSRAGPRSRKTRRMLFKRKEHDLYEFERSYHLLRISACENINNITDSVLNDMNVLISKSAALLQFISVVLAALTFSLSLVDASAPYAHYIRAGILIFIACFATAAWVDMRCLYSMGARDVDVRGSVADYEKALLNEITKRRENYGFALHLSLNSFMLLMPFVLVWTLLAARASIPFD